MQLPHNSPFRFIERAGLMIIMLAVLYAIVEKCWAMWDTNTVTVTDILLLFMYLELITMVRLYWQEGRLSVLMPIFIAVIGIARHMMADSQEFGQHDLIFSAGAIVLLSLSLLILAYCQVRFSFYPSHDDREMLTPPSEAQTQTSERTDDGR